MANTDAVVVLESTDWARLAERSRETSEALALSSSSVLTVLSNQDLWQVFVGILHIRLLHEQLLLSLILFSLVVLDISATTLSTTEVNGAVPVKTLVKVVGRIEVSQEVSDEAAT